MTDFRIIRKSRSSHLHCGKRVWGPLLPTELDQAFRGVILRLDQCFALLVRYRFHGCQHFLCFAHRLQNHLRSESSLPTRKVLAVTTITPNHCHTTIDSRNARIPAMTGITMEKTCENRVCKSDDRSCLNRNLVFVGNLLHEAGHFLGRLRGRRPDDR